MKSFYFLGFVIAFISLFGLLEIILLKIFNKEWWEKRWIRRAAWSLPLLGLSFFIIWVFAEYNRISWLSLPMAAGSALVFILEVGLMFSLPLSGLIHLLRRLIERWRHSGYSENESQVDNMRRDFLKGLAAAVPLATIGSGVGGVARSFGKVVVEKKIMKIAGLPADLDGLKILHISDTHLRHYVTLDDLDQLLTDAAPFSPDIVCLIGDVADDLDKLPEALKMVHSLTPPLGTYATLGNHEYFRGIERVLRIYKSSDIPLFVNERVRLSVGETTLFIGGIDDPRRMGTSNEAFFRNTINQTFADLAEGEFSLLLSHRPDAFAYAATKGINLTLAGHTHGGQIGFMGRSILSGAFPESYLWGEYRIGGSYLYTSSGAGHWFPFRLGCPSEAPIIELRPA